MVVEMVARVVKLHPPFRKYDSLIDVLGQPAEAFAVSLSLENGAHEELQWTAGEF